MHQLNAIQQPGTGLALTEWQDVDIRAVQQACDARVAAVAAGQMVHQPQQQLRAGLLIAMDPTHQLYANNTASSCR